MALNREKIVASAQKFIQRGQLDKAIKEFQRIVEEDPKDVRTLLKIGDLYSKKGERDNAIQTYLKVAEFYSEQGFFLKAVAVFKQILKVDPSLIDVNVKLADLYGQLGLGSDALTQYQNVALYYEKAGQIPKTLQILRKMVDLDPQNVGIRIKLAEMFAKETQNKEAIDEFREAARVLKESQRLTDYAKVAERILFLDPENLVLAKELAEMYLKTQDVKRALAKLQVCFKADPRDVSVLEMLASAFLALGQTPKTVSVYRELAKIHAEKGEYEKRRQYLKNILELQPDDEETRSELELKAPASAAPAHGEEAVGAPKAEKPQAPPPPIASPLKPTEMIAKLLTETDVYVKYGLKDKALEHLKKIFSLAPHNLDAHAKVRDIYLQAGDIEGAGSTLMSMAEIAEREGKRELAEGWLREVAKLIPGHPTATAKLNAITPDEAEILDDDMIQEAPPDDDAGVEMVVDAPPEPEEPQEDSLPPLPDAAFDDTPGPSEGVALTEAMPSALDLSPTSDQVALEVDDGLEMPMSDDEPEPQSSVEPISGETELSDDLSDDDGGIEDEDEDDDITDDDESADAPPLPSVSFTPDSGIDLPPPSEDELSLELEPPKKGISVQSGEARIDPKPRVQSGESSLQRGAPPAVAFDDDLMEPAAPSLELDAPQDELELDLPPRVSEPPEPIEDEKTSPEEIAEEEPEDSSEADVDVSDELEEADFFEQQGLEDEAVEVYKNVLKKLPKNDVALKALARLGVDVPGAAATAESASDKGGTDKFATIAPTPVKSATPPAPAPAAKPLAAITTAKAPPQAVKPAATPAPTKPTTVAPAAVKPATPPAAIASAVKPATPPAAIASAVKPATPPVTSAPKVGGVTKSLINDSALGGDGFDLASELADDFADAENTAAADAPQEELQFSVEDVLSEFKKGVAATVSDKDYATHYDLGIAYKEMGLTDEAIREFEISSRATEKEVDSWSMIGVCRMELADHKGAIEAFKRAANSDRINAQQAVAIQYELANAHEAAGDADTAKSLFAKVAKLDPKFRDAGVRAAGTAPAEDVDLAAQGSKDAPAKKGKISYL